MGWALGSSFYNRGYSAYANPYYGAEAVAQPIVFEQVVDSGAPQTVTVPLASYDYSQPLDTQSTPPAAEVADSALAQFEAARTAFRAGDYAAALTQTDAALKALPNDATLHEFRALVLFAVGQYDQAAGPLYAVLSVGPGWDWTTLIGLYPNVGVYTAQVRKLEAFVTANPKSAAGHFVLAYHYLTQNHVESAVAQLKKVVAPAPQDTLSAQLINQFSPPTAPTEPAAPATAAANTPAVAAVKSGQLAGSWTAQAPGNTTIALEARPDGTFTWTVTAQGPPRVINGQWSLTNDLLALAPDGSGGPMVGRTSWKSEQEWAFVALGAGPKDAGLTFRH